MGGSAEALEDEEDEREIGGIVVVELKNERSSRVLDIWRR
jgi:hypothetical protein